MFINDLAVPTLANLSILAHNIYFAKCGSVAGYVGPRNLQISAIAST